MTKKNVTEITKKMIRWKEIVESYFCTKISEIVKFDENNLSGEKKLTKIFKHKFTNFSG